MTPSKERPDFWDGDVPWVSPKDMKRPVLDDAEDHITAQALQETGIRLHPVDSVLVVTRGMILAHTFPVAMNAVPVTVNQDMKVLRAHAGVSARYLAWMLKGLQSLMLSLTDESAHGTKALRTDQWANLAVPVPKTAEQERIANFLDEQTARTDALIAEKDLLAKSFSDYRQSVITVAVGGGTAPEDAPEASISKLFPVIPKGWTLTRVGYLASKIGSGKTPSGGAEVYPSEGIPFLRSMNVYDEGLQLDELVFITPEMDEDLRATRLAEDDILFNITGASIGRTCLVPANILPANINQHACLIRISNRAIVGYVSLALKSGQTKAQVDAFQNGAAREGLNFDQVARIAVLVPDNAAVAQNTAISVELRLRQIDTLAAQIAGHVNSLREYRSSLISAAVTGQLDLGTFKAAA